MMKTTRKIMISAAILTLLLGVMASSVSAQTTEIVTDGVDDVIIAGNIFDEQSTDTTFEKTSDKPSIDITKMTFIKEDDSQQVTIKLEVNSRGAIENGDDIEATDPDAISFPMVVYMYAVTLETSDNTYEVNYMAGNCTVNYDTAVATVSDNELTVDFDIDSSEETYVSMTGITTLIEFNSLEDFGYYMDIAPDSALFVAAPSGPASAQTGEEITFTGDYDDPLELTYGPYTYSWNFDDGTTSTQQNPTHTYQYPGDYDVSLIVEDSQGISSEEYSVQVSVTSGSSTDNNSSGNDTNDGSESDEGSGLLMFVAVIAIIVIIGVVALIFVIRR